MKIRLRYKGGPGSGNFEHRGRPGFVGGSGTSWSVFNKPGPTKVYHGTYGYRIAYGIMKEGLKRGAEHFHRPPSVYFTAKKEEAMRFARLYEGIGTSLLIEFGLPDTFDPEVIVDDIANRDFGWVSAYRVEEDIPPEYIKSISAYKEGKKYATVTRSEFDKMDEVDLAKRFAYNKELSYWTVVFVDDGLDYTMKGGSGSGNFGHAGRPGEVGGSRTEGGSGYTGGRLRWHSALTSEARLEPNGDILVGPKFFKWEKDTQAEILAHEMGHGILDMTRATTGDEFWKTGEIVKMPGTDYWYGGNYKIEEGAADAMMARAMYPEELLSKHPGIYKWATEQYRKVGIDPAALRAQVIRIANRIDAGPEGAIMTLEDL